MLNLEDLTYTGKFPPFLQALASAHAPALCTEIASTAFFPFSSEPSTHRQSRPPQHSELQMMPRGGLTPQSLAPDGCIPKKKPTKSKRLGAGGVHSWCRETCSRQFGFGKSWEGEKQRGLFGRDCSCLSQRFPVPSSTPSPSPALRGAGAAHKKQGKEKDGNFLQLI